MTADGWAQAVRHQLGPGRILPLGGPGDGAWITERAACEVLSQAVARAGGVRLGTVRIRPAAPGTAPETAPRSAAPAPRRALPPGPLRIEAEFSAPARQPLLHTARQLRRTLFAAATERLGLPTAEIDLRVVDLLDDPAPAGGAAPRDPSPVAAAGTAASPAEADGAMASPAAVSGPPHRSPRPAPGPVPVREPAAELADAATAVPGATRLAPVPEPSAAQPGRRLAQAVRIEDSDDPPGRHIRIQLATAEDRRVLDVARAARTAVARAAEGDAPGPVTVTVLVTAVEPAGGPPA